MEFKAFGKQGQTTILEADLRNIGYSLWCASPACGEWSPCFKTPCKNGPDKIDTQVPEAVKCQVVSWLNRTPGRIENLMSRI